MADGAAERATDLTGVLTLKHDDLYLLTDAFGDVHPDRRALGLYSGDTRILSRYELRVDGHRPVVLRTGAGVGYESVVQLTNPDLVPASSAGGRVVPLGQQQLGIVRERLLSGVFRERIRVRNFTSRPERVRVSLTVAADRADIFEVRGLQRTRTGEQLPSETDGERALALGYRGLDDVVRWTRVVISEAGRIDAREGRVDVDLDLAPATERLLEITIWGEESGATDTTATAGDLSAQPPPSNPDAPAASHRAWRTGSTAITTSSASAQRAIDRALGDLRLLVNHGPLPGERYIAAGVPWFSCLFGRDALITALQLLPIRPQVAVETLDLLARLQATEVDDERDAQPGKILHELRTGELARTGEIPHSPYFGSVDSTPLWLVLLGETYAWTGDLDSVRRLWPVALAALRWIDEHGDIDGDGFVEDVHRSGGRVLEGEAGLANQGWKDSRDANRRRDGSIPDGPLALVEVQAYVYLARRHVARLAAALGEDALAAEQDAAAHHLRERFEAAFWMEDEGAYALALDGAKQQVDAVASNMGHVLWAGLASPVRAARVADTLLAADMWSGWGIRTLSSGMLGYNPIGYHIGSVWPHDNAIAADGLARYGERAAAATVAGAMLEATSHFREGRLPELFCGFDRAESPYPVPYPVACVPQSWAAGAVFQLVAALLGLRPDATARRLELVSPTLPAWLPDLRVENLRVGGAQVDLAFRAAEPGAEGSAAVQVLRRTGDLDVVVRV